MTGDRHGAAMTAEELDALRGALRAHARDVAEHFYPQGRKEGRNWRVHSKGSLSICIEGAKRGLWKNFEGDDGGDLFKLIQEAVPTNFAGAVAWVESQGWASGRATVEAKRRPAIGPTEADRNRRKIERARAQWRESVPIDGTLAEVYLRRHRSISGPVSPDAVRFHPDFRQADYQSRGVPALIVASTNPAGEILAIQGVELDRETGAKVDKRTNGHRADDMAWIAPGIPGSPLLITEGPENALSLVQALPHDGVSATLGVTQFPKIVNTLPKDRRIIFVADSDAADSAARKTFDRAVADAIALGCDVRVARPPEGIKDSNDLLRARGVGAVRAMIEAAAAPDEASEDGPPAVAVPSPRPHVVILPGVEPHYATAPMAPEAVAAELRRLIPGFVERALMTARIRRDIAKAQAEAEAVVQAEAEAQAEANIPAADAAMNFAPKYHMTRTYRAAVRKARRAAKGAVLEGYGPDQVPPPPRLQIAAGAGSGKSEAFFDAVRSVDGARDAVIHDYVSSHALAHGLADRGRAKGLHVRVILGRSAKGDDGKPMCRKPKLAERVGKLGMNVKKAICKNAEQQCEHYGKCPYMRQVDGLDSGGVIILMAHSYLFTDPPDGVPAADLVVIDESIVLGSLEHKSLNPLELGEPRWWGKGNAETADFLDLCRRLREALLSGEPIKAALAARGITIEGLSGAARFAETAQDAAPLVAPAMTESQGLKALEAFKGSPRALIARLLRQLAAEMKIDRDAIHSVEVRETMATTESGERVKVPMIYLHRRKQPHVDRDTPLLVIDADGTEAAAVRLFGDTIQHVSLPTRRNAIVCQVADQGFAKAALLVSEFTSRRNAQTVTGRLDKVRRTIRALVTLHPPVRLADGRLRPSVLVVANKPVRCAITGERSKGKLAAGFDWHGATIASFGNIRGIDLWKDYSVVVIVGREQPPPLEAEAAARALYWDDPAPLELPGVYRRQERGFRMAGGERLGCKVWVAPDPRVQGLLELVREREIAQATDRLRMVYRDRPALVFVLGSLPVDLDVDRLSDLDGDLLRLEMEAARVRRGGVLPLSPDWLAENEPAIFQSGGNRPVTKKAVQRVLESAGMLSNDSPLSPIYYLLENGDYPNRIEFQVSGRPGRPLKALMVPCRRGGAWMLRRMMKAPIAKIDGLPLTRNYAFAGWPSIWGPAPWDDRLAEIEAVEPDDRHAVALRSRDLPGGYAAQERLPVPSEILIAIPDSVDGMAWPAHNESMIEGART